tara:strand:+ start:195 stop:383 length:189 start_codon:yes stop_codon:yes gene_type:complete
MKVGDLVKHKTASLGIGMVTGFKERSSGVFVRWLNTGTLEWKPMGRGTREVDIMLEVVSASR